MIARESPISARIHDSLIDPLCQRISGNPLILGLDSACFKIKSERIDLLNRDQRMKFANTAMSTGILMFLGLICASVCVALVLTVQMVLELFL